ncbi:hypothetical protein SLE2022_280980 [Rubroshorea leprosula]
MATSTKPEIAKEEVAVEVEPNTGVPFPVKLDDGKLQLNCVGVRRKSILGLGIKVYAFGIYADNEKLKDLMKSKIGTAPPAPTKEMYDVVIESDVPMMIRMSMTFSNISNTPLVKSGFADDIAGTIKKLNGGKRNDELSKMVMGPLSDNVKLKVGSLIEIYRLSGYVLQTKVMGELVSKVDSELLCKTMIYFYLGHDDLDKEAREKFGMFLLSLF